jgi:integrase
MPRVTVVQPSPSVGLERAVDDYLSSCRARGLSPRTMTAYANPLLHVFLPWCAEQGIAEVGQLDQRALDRFTAHLLDVGGAKGALSKFSVAAYVRPVRQLLVWARKEGEAVAGQPQLPRLPRRVLDVLSREEIARLEEAAVAERDQLIIRVLADTGMRVGELVGLGADAIVRQGRDAYLRVQGKGERERLVPVSPSLVRRIERHLRSRRKDTYSDRLFLALRRGRDGCVRGTDGERGGAAGQGGGRERRPGGEACPPTCSTARIRHPCTTRWDEPDARGSGGRPQ